MISTKSSCWTLCKVGRVWVLLKTIERIARYFCIFVNHVCKVNRYQFFRSDRHIDSSNHHLSVLQSDQLVHLTRLESHSKIFCRYFSVLSSKVVVVRYEKVGLRGLKAIAALRFFVFVHHVIFWHPWLLHNLRFLSSHKFERQISSSSILRLICSSSWRPLLVSAAALSHALIRMYARSGQFFRNYGILRLHKFAERFLSENTDMLGHWLHSSIPWAVTSLFLKSLILHIETGDFLHFLDCFDRSVEIFIRAENLRAGHLSSPKTCKVQILARIHRLKSNPLLVVTLVKAILASINRLSLLAQVEDHTANAHVLVLACHLLYVFILRVLALLMLFR